MNERRSRLPDLAVYRRTRVALPSFGWSYRRPTRFSVERAQRDTRRALEILLPRPERVWTSRKESPWGWEIPVDKRNIILYGGQKTGKSHGARWIAQQIIKRYVELGYTVRLLRHRADVRGLLYGIPRDADVAVLLAEDFTAALADLKPPEKAALAREWYLLRHRFHKATGKKHGIIYTILCVHRLHDVPPAFRMDLDLLVFKSVPTTPWDETILRAYIGEAGIEFLSEMERERINDDLFIGYGLWWHRRETGVWYCPPYDGPDLYDEIGAAAKPRTEPKFGEVFNWKESILPIIEEKHPRYARLWEAVELRGLDPRDKEFHRITGLKKSRGYELLKEMRDDKAFQGFISKERGRLFEIYLKQRLEREGWTVSPKVRFTHQGVEYEVDLLAERDGERKVINAKCGQPGSSYPFEKWKSEYYYMTETGIPAELWLYNIETDEITAKPIPRDRSTISF